MRTITKEQLTEILDKHRKWRRGEADGARADLAGAYLAGARNLPSGVEAKDPPESYARP